VGSYFDKQFRVTNFKFFLYLTQASVCLYEEIRCVRSRRILSAALKQQLDAEDSGLQGRCLVSTAEGLPMLRRSVVTQSSGSIVARRKLESLILDSFNLEDGGSTLLQKNRRLLTSRHDVPRNSPEAFGLHQYRCENLKPRNCEYVTATIPIENRFCRCIRQQIINFLRM
jgi:hypothetical protein